MNLLAYSKEREPLLQLVHPGKLIDECIEADRDGGRRQGAMVVADVDPDHPAIPLDPTACTSADEFVSNSLDAVEAGRGLIRVIARYEAEHQTS